MRYAATLTALGAALVVMGLRLSLWGVLLIWLGTNFVLLGIAHFRGTHGLFGKRPDGTLPVWSWLLFFPLLIYTAGVWHLIRLFSQEPRINRVSDNLVVGRRLLAHEWPRGFYNYIDLTAEFEEPRPLRQSRNRYRAFPILDASAPTPEALREAVLRLSSGSTFVHCAQGHGRTGLFAMAVMLSSGAVHDVGGGFDSSLKCSPGDPFEPRARELHQSICAAHGESKDVRKAPLSDVYASILGRNRKRKAQTRRTDATLGFQDGHPGYA